MVPLVACTFGLPASTSAVQIAVGAHHRLAYTHKLAETTMWSSCVYKSVVHTNN